MTTEATGAAAPTPQGGNQDLYAGAPAPAPAPAPSAAPATAPAAAPAAPANAPAPAPAAPAVPESYAFEMPDGVELDKAAAEEFSAVAKELKLDQATAQKVADVAVKMQQRQAETHQKQVEQWTAQTKADKEIGGEKLDENLAVARKAIDAFGTPELKTLLNGTGLGNHPEIVKAFYKAGKAISEDRFVPGAPKNGADDASKVLFPSMN